MSLYPSLEDMKVDQMMQAQVKIENQYAQTHTPQIQSTPYTIPSAPQSYPQLNAVVPSAPGTMYPVLNDFMGLELSQSVIEANMPELLKTPSNQISTVQPNQVATVGTTSTGLVAPLSGQSAGLQRATVTNGVRELTLCKDANGQVGLRVKAINNGIFVCLVIAGSPAALSGLRFGDQILTVNRTQVAGFTMDKVHTLFKKSPVNGIVVTVRDRPFERNVTLFKDSHNRVGFMFKNGKITQLVQGSSAARNGLLTEHQLLEVNGQNVIGMKDSDVTKIIDNGGQCVTLTIIPSFIYDHMVKKMSVKLLVESMDHSIPAI